MSDFNESDLSNEMGLFNSFLKIEIPESLIGKKGEKLADVSIDEPVSVDSLEVDEEAVVMESVSSNVEYETPEESMPVMESETFIPDSVEEKEIPVLESDFDAVEYVIPRHASFVSDDDITHRIEETLAFFTNAVIRSYNESQQNKSRTAPYDVEIAKLEAERSELIKEKEAAVALTIKSIKERIDKYKKYYDEEKAEIDSKLRDTRLELQQKEVKLAEYQSEHAALSEKLIAAQKSSSGTPGDLIKIEQLTLDINDYDASIRDITNKIMDLKNKINELAKSSDELKENYKSKIKQENEKFNNDYGEYTLDENGKAVYHGKNHPKVKEIDQKIECIKQKKTLLTSNPRVIYDRIIRMMDAREDVELISEQLNLLVQIFGANTVSGVLPWKQEERAELEKSIIELRRRRKELEKKISGKDGDEYFYYFNQNEKNKDEEKILNLEKQNEAYNLELSNLISERQYYERQGEVKEIQESLTGLRKNIELQKITMESLPLTDDDKVVYGNAIKLLENQELILTQKLEAIRAAKPTKSASEIAVEIRDLKNKIAENTDEIERLRTKSNDDYIDNDSRSRDIAEREVTDDDISLKENRLHLLETETISVKGLIRTIIDEYRKSLSEPVVKTVLIDEIDETDETDLFDELRGYDELTFELGKVVNEKSFIEHAKEEFERLISEAREKFTSLFKAKKKKQTEFDEVDSVLEEYENTTYNVVKPGKFYIKMDDQAVEIEAAQVMNYWSQGYDVYVTSVSNNGEISFTPLNMTAVDDNRKSNRV